MDKLAPVVNRAVQVGAIALATRYLLSGILYLCFSYWNMTQADLRFFHGDQVVLFIVDLVLLIVSTSLLPVWRDRTIDLTGGVSRFWP